VREHGHPTRLIGLGDSAVEPAPLGGTTSRARPRVTCGGTERDGTGVVLGGVVDDVDPVDKCGHRVDDIVDERCLVSGGDDRRDGVIPIHQWLR